MKIAILSHGYSGATLPLARHLAEQGHNVDCYYLCWHGATQMESMDYGRKMSARDNLIVLINKIGNRGEFN